jgi:hypothetical protein
MVLIYCLKIKRAQSMRGGYAGGLEMKIFQQLKRIAHQEILCNKIYFCHSP